MIYVHNIISMLIPTTHYFILPHLKDYTLQLCIHYQSKLLTVIYNIKLFIYTTYLNIHATLYRWFPHYRAVFLHSLQPYSCLSPFFHLEWKKETQLNAPRKKYYKLWKMSKQICKKFTTVVGVVQKVFWYFYSTGGGWAVKISAIPEYQLVTALWMMRDSPLFTTRAENL